VVNLGEAPLFPHEHRCRAAEWLDVDAVRREVRDDPRREPPLAAVIAQNRAFEISRHCLVAYPCQTPALFGRDRETTFSSGAGNSFSACTRSISRSPVGSSM